MLIIEYSIPSLHSIYHHYAINNSYTNLPWYFGSVITSFHSSKFIIYLILFYLARIHCWYYPIEISWIIEQQSISTDHHHMQRTNSLVQPCHCWLRISHEIQGNERPSLREEQELEILTKGHQRWLPIQLKLWEGHRLGIQLKQIHPITNRRFRSIHGWEQERRIRYQIRWCLLRVDLNPIYNKHKHYPD